jgi:hypothetical protein
MDIIHKDLIPNEIYVIEFNRIVANYKSNTPYVMKFINYGTEFPHILNFKTYETTELQPYDSEISIITLYRNINRYTKDLVFALCDRASFYYERDVPHQRFIPKCMCRKCIDERVRLALKLECFNVDITLFE